MADLNFTPIIVFTPLCFNFLKAVLAVITVITGITVNIEILND